jgi:hypothetical protein
LWRIFRSNTLCFDQIPNLQNCFTTPNKNLGARGPQIDKHLPPSTFTCQFFKKAKSRNLGFGVFIDIWYMLFSIQYDLAPIIPFKIFEPYLCYKKETGIVAQGFLYHVSGQSKPLNFTCCCRRFFREFDKIYFILWSFARCHHCLG